MVKDIVSPGFWVGDGYVDGSEPSELTNVNGTLFFIARDQAHGHELWKSDGTEAGTVLVKDILPGSWYSWPGNLTNVNGALFFTADDGAHGPELWKSDGNSGSTAPDGKPDTIIFGPGITPEDLRVQMQVGSTDGVYGMKLAIGIGENEGPVIQAGRGATGSDPSDLAIRRFVLADGTVLTLGDILARGDGVVGYQEGTYGDDTLRGSVTNDEIYGFAGNDESYGGAGDRILDGTRQLFLDKTAILPVINYLGELGFAASLFLSFGASTHGPPSPAQHALPALSRVACSTGKTRGRFTQYRNTVGS
jgi:ELWxxDGT repeat protein